jgi:hypothetical protein
MRKCHIAFLRRKKMKRYKAYATISYDLECEFEVEDDEDAWDFARELDGGDFKELDGSGDWKVYEVEEIKEKENEL